MRCQRDGFSIDAGLAKRRGLPDWYLDEPYVPPDIRSLYFEAFDDLCTTRQRGFDLGPIPWDQIVNYADRSNLDPANAQAFVRVIREMDSAWLAWADAERQRERKAAEAKAAQRG